MSDEISYLEYLNMDSKIPFLDKKWKLFLFIFLIFTSIYVFTLSGSLISSQVTGCSQISDKEKQISATQININNIVNENNNCQKTLTNFTDNLNVFKNKTYFTNSGASGTVKDSKDDTGFTNVIVTGFKGFSDFKDIPNYDTNFNYNNQNINVENFNQKYIEQLTELNKSENLYNTLTKDIESEKSKTANLEKIKNDAQNKFDIVNSKYTFENNLKNQIKTMIDNINSSGNNTLLIKDLTNKIDEFNRQKTNLVSGKIILENKQKQQENLINSLTENNKNLLDKIKNVDCGIYV